MEYRYDIAHKIDEEQLTADILELARQYGRYGYRKIAAFLRQAGWLVNDKRVERIWRLSAAQPWFEIKHKSSRRQP